MSRTASKIRSNWIWKVLMFLSVALLSGSLATANDNSSQVGVCQVPWKYNDQRHKRTYIVGVLAIRGYEAAIQEFNQTFSTYLTATAGQMFDEPIEFVMKPLNFLLLFSDVEEQQVDFIYVNPSAYSCIESQYTSFSLVSQVSRRNIQGNVYNLQKFGGCIYARADNDEIHDIYDIKDKVVASASISGLGSGQMQFLEMERAGMSYINDPKQLVFTSNQGKVIQGVLDGKFDVGFVRTDQLERSKTADGEPVNLDDFKIISPKADLTIDGEPFPFASSTELYPEWNVAALAHVPKDVSEAVMYALLALDDHANYGERLAANETNDDMFRCDSTPQVAELAIKARTAGKYSAWQTTLSYMQLRSMQEATGFISQEPGTDLWTCVRSSKIYDAISCPEGYYRKSEGEIEAGCSTIGETCEDGYQCICSPCALIEECIEGIEIGDNCVPYSTFLPALLVPLFVVISVLAYGFVVWSTRQADAVWRINASELKFDEPPAVVGVGTFGYVILAEYRGTQVAVKRVIPPDEQKCENDSDSPKFLDAESPKCRTELSPNDTNPGLRTMTPEMMDRVQRTASSYGIKIKKKSHRQLRREFVEEMRHLSKLRHPCITTVMGAVMSVGEPMMVMEYMEHGSLYESLRNDNIQFQVKDSMMVILQDIARGLRFLHAAHPQVVHGDLKTRNVLIDANLRAKVSDFGMSHKKYRSRASGTPFWMAPELFDKRGVNTAASDIYAFGILIYEVYTCEDPYEGENADDVLRQVCDPSIDKRPPIPDACPSRIAELMRECIARDPASRPTAEQVDLLLRVEENVLERTNRLEDLNKSLARANEKIASASAMQLEHFASMSHEIRTPLNCVVGIASLLEDDQELKGSQRESVNMIVSSGNLLRQIIDDVLDYSKLESGRFDVLVERADLQFVIMDVVNSMKNSTVMRNRQVTLRLYIDPFLDRQFQIDSRRLQQILFNLLSNAVKYNRVQGHVDFDVRLLTRDQPLPEGHGPLMVDGQHVLRLSVKDTGKGIEKSDFENIFHPFTQTRTGWQSTEGGTGLGLSITRKLVERLDGKITVDSKLGEWSMFTVDFPYASVPVDMSNVKEKLKNSVVLYVNDDPSESEEIFKNSCAAYAMPCVLAQSLQNLSAMELPQAKTLFLVVHGDLFDQDVLRSIPGSTNWIIITFGTDFSAARAQMHYLSLEQQFPSSLMVDLAQALEDTKKESLQLEKKVRIAPDDVNLSHVRILVAEDNKVNQKVMTRLLNRIGIAKVDISENGRVAVAMDLQTPYDAILMDMQMPEMDGIEATKCIVAREGPKPKIIFVTAHVSDNFRTTCLETGASGYVAKPCTIDVLRKTLIEQLV